MGRAWMMAMAGLLIGGCGRLGFDGVAAPGGVGLSYPTSDVDAVVGRSSIALEPTATGDALRFEIAPALPAGVQLDAGTGVISGVPAELVDEVTYTVTAANADGSARFELRLTVLPGSVVDSVADVADDDGGADLICFATPANGCTLRAAVETANARTTKQLVLLDARIYALDGPLADIDNDVVIAGRSAASTTVRATTPHPGYGMVAFAKPKALWLRNAMFRDFGKADGAVVHVTAGKLHVAAAAFTNNTSAGSGGVFFVAGGATAVIERSTFTANSSSGGCCGGWGGVIDGEDAGTAIIVRASTATENTAAWGSFSHITTGTTLALENATLYRNVAMTAGTLASPGGVYTLLNDTIVHNTNTNANPESAGIYLFNPPCAYTIANTILAFNRDSSGGDNNCNHRVANTSIKSNGGNILSDTGGNCTDELRAPGDRLGADPGLDAGGLADHGGPTETILLTAGSIAIDGARNAPCPAQDQRGFARPGAPASCDVGAVEHPE